MTHFPADRVALGRFAETVAADFLGRRGGVVLARNVESKAGELDLIVGFDDEVAAIEVRSGRGNRGDELLFPEQKETQVRRVAASLEPPIFRIDLVTVLLDETGVRVRWHPRV